MAASISQRSGASIVVSSSEAKGFAVFAQVEFGQWIAKCECGGVEFVDPHEPIFFCFGCANRTNGGALRPVIFPDERAEIERLVLERPVDDLRGLDDLDRAYQAKPIVFAEVTRDNESFTLPLSRSWTPNESVDELRRQNEAVYAWRAQLENGGE
jgi:hypothetical protein